MGKGCKRCNGLEHVPTCATWPPAWLVEPSALTDQVAEAATDGADSGTDEDDPPASFTDWRENGPYGGERR